MFTNELSSFLKNYSRVTVIFVPKLCLIFPWINKYTDDCMCIHTFQKYYSMDINIKSRKQICFLAAIRGQFKSADDKMICVLRRLSVVADPKIYSLCSPRIFTFKLVFMQENWPKRKDLCEWREYLINLALYFFC